MQRELTEGKEYWVKLRLDVVDDDETTLIPYRFSTPESNAAHWFPDDIEAVEVITEQKKVTIPKEVADYIEESKKAGRPLGIAMWTTFTPADVYNWMYNSGKKNITRQELFARAWLDGYTVEEPEEPLGVLLLDLPEKGYWKYNYVRIIKNEEVFVDGSDITALLVEYARKITEAEAKEKYPNFKWVSLEELGNEV